MQGMVHVWFRQGRLDGFEPVRKGRLAEQCIIARSRQVTWILLEGGAGWASTCSG